MKNMTPRLMANACGGILHFPEMNEAAANLEVTDIVTDSRKAAEGMLFAAIPGERVDGHSYIRQVCEKGASCILCERDLTEGDIPAGYEDCVCWIRVPSTLGALRDLGEYYLQQMGIPAVGIVGSVGKTSTKEMVAAVLSQKYRVCKTQGNFNNELGVPLTIFRIREEDEIAVLEMGISDFGEMHRLSRIVHPDTVVMTNIGECHLEFLGDRDGVLKAKSEVFDYLHSDGHIILNGNDDKLLTLQNVGGIRPVFFGIPVEKAQGVPVGAEQTPLTCFADEIEALGLDGTKAAIHTPGGSFTCTIPIPGKHMVMNALAGTAVGLAYGMDPQQIREGIESLQPVSGRFHIVKTGRMTIIDDCYNANPISMKASLGVLGDALGRRVAVLGDMAELGSEERRFHLEVGAFARECGIDALITIGDRGKWIGEGAGDGILQAHYDSTQSFLEAEKTLLQPGDTVLVKASHCMAFEKIVAALENREV